MPVNFLSRLQLEPRPAPPTAPLVHPALPAPLPVCVCAPPARPPPSSEEEELLKEALLSDTLDVERGGSAKKRKHSWLALVGIAAKYMWPEEFWLQVRFAGAGAWGLRW